MKKKFSEDFISLSYDFPIEDEEEILFMLYLKEIPGMDIFKIILDLFFKEFYMCEESKQDDLKFMVAQTLKASHDKSALLDSPYYKIRDLRFFDDAHSKMYSAYAKVDFFIYRDIKMYEERKYRYDNHYLQWDRYLKEWHFGTDNDEK